MNNINNRNFTLTTTQKLMLFAAKHHIILLIITAILTFSALSLDDFFIYFIHPRFDFLLSLASLLLFVFFYLILLFISTSPARLNSNAIKDMTNGDPEPLFYITQILLNYKAPKLNRQAFLINHCVALREMGEYQKSIELLNTLDIKENSRYEYVYYHNLADGYAMLGDMENFIINYNKSMTAYNRIKFNFIKNRFATSIFHINLQRAYMEKQYDYVINASQSYFKAPPSKYKTISSDTDVCLLCALAYIQKGMLNEARYYLYAITQKGKKLHAVTIARDLLEKISK